MTLFSRESRSTAPSLRLFLKHGTGVLNIDGCRIGTDDVSCEKAGGGGQTFHGQTEKPRVSGSTAGRFPANLVLSHAAGCVEIGTNGTETVAAYDCTPDCPVKLLNEQSGETPSRFFYCAKPSTGEKDAGLLNDPQVVNESCPPGAPGSNSPRAGAGRTGKRQNFHPTVKPVELMRYFCRLITPPGGTVLDPFVGSGTTCIAALSEGFHFAGFEQDEKFHRIATERVTAWFPKAEQIK